MPPKSGVVKSDRTQDLTTFAKLSNLTGPKI